MNIENAKLEDMVKGYSFEGGNYRCLLCGKSFEKEEIFKIEDRFFTAQRATMHHMEEKHSERLKEMLDSDSKYLSLTEKQKELFLLFQSGLSDTEIAKALGVSASTVRHQKFVFREKAKAAKLYLAVWSLVEGKSDLLPVHNGAKMVDERYIVTKDESKKILENVFESLEPLKLKVFSKKEKKKIVILNKISAEFVEQKIYSEKEVNEILGDIYDDFATLRRYLIEYGYMERTRDGKAYWRK